MIVGVVREADKHERRVALVPAVLPTMAKSRLESLIEKGTGEAASYPDSSFEQHGARLPREPLLS